MIRKVKRMVKRSGYFHEIPLRFKSSRDGGERSSSLAFLSAFLAKSCLFLSRFARSVLVIREEKSKGLVMPVFVQDKSVQIAK